MRQFFIPFALIAAPLVAGAQERAIEDVISRQLEAFTARDVETAWTFASPMIQGIFRTPENFGTMVRAGYPMVWDNENLRFLDQTVGGARVQQDVLIQGPNGAEWLLEYEMVETPDGWRINGVRILPVPEPVS